MNYTIADIGRDRIKNLKKDLDRIHKALEDGEKDEANTIARSWFGVSSYSDFLEQYEKLAGLDLPNALFATGTEDDGEVE